MTGMLPAISNYYHHLEYFWVISACDPGFAMWITSRWKCTNVVVNGHFVCVGCHNVWSGWKSALKTRNHRFFAPQHDIDFHTPGSGQNPVFLLTTYMLWWPHETSSSILTNKLPRIFGGFWFGGFGSLGGFLPNWWLKGFSLHLHFPALHPEANLSFLNGESLHKKIWLFFLRVLWGTQNNVNVLFSCFNGLSAKKGGDHLHLSILQLKMPGLLSVSRVRPYQAKSL